MKYMGSKSRIAKDILPFIQDCIDKNNITHYIENFCGGCNVIDKVRCNIRIGLDKQTFLIDLLKNLDKLSELPEVISREHYTEVRNDFNSIIKNPSIYKQKFENWYIGAIGFLASYNGRFFDGGFAQSGYEKTKNGERFRDYYNESKNNLLQQIDDLKDVKFQFGEYYNTEWVAEYYNFKLDSNVFVYSDPPYKNTKQYGISKDFDYDAFYKDCRELSTKTYHVISEQEMPEDFICIWEKPVSRSIKSTDKSKATEKLFTHKDGLYYKWFISKNK